MIKKNFFIPILAVAMLSTALMTSQDAFAHNDVLCNTPGGTAQLIPFIGATIITEVSNGDSMFSIYRLSEVADGGGVINCAFDGGTIASPAFVGNIDITNPDGTLQTINSGNIPCIGGTTNVGDLLLPADCAAALSTFDSAQRTYSVDCADDGKNNDPTDGNLRWNAVFNGRSHQNTGDVTDLIREDNLVLPCVSNYSFVTESTPKGTVTTIPVSNPSDKVTITAATGVDGTFLVTAILKDPGNASLDTPVCNGGVAKVASGTFDVTCTTSGLSLTAAGTYCWDVTVDEQTTVYDENDDGTHIGTLQNNECFTIELRVPEFEYFVGGGKILMSEGEKQKDNVYLTHGFELHCDDLSGPNNLEVNWDSGDGRFHLEQLVAADCNDDGSVNEPPPSSDTSSNGPGPTTDVYQGEGWGRYNGECGAFAEWVFDDNGEPGKADHIVALRITDAGNNVVLDLNPGEQATRDTASAGTWKDPGTDSDPWFDLITGNHQWVPHPTPTHGPTGTQPCDPQ